MKLPVAPDKYAKADQDSLRRALSDTLKNTVKKDEEWNPVRFVLRDESTGVRYLVTVVTTLGVPALTLTAVA